MSSIGKAIGPLVNIALLLLFAVIIFASQIRDLLGLSLSAPEPGEIVAKVEALWAAIAERDDWTAFQAHLGAMEAARLAYDWPMLGSKP